MVPVLDVQSRGTVIKKEEPILREQLISNQRGSADAPIPKGEMENQATYEGVASAINSSQRISQKLRSNKARQDSRHARYALWCTL